MSKHPKCNRTSKSLCTYKCGSCHNLSFASHPRAKNWSSKNKLSPRQVRLHSNQKFWFKCDVCFHTFESRPDNIVKNDSWCPYCSKSVKKLCNDEKCDHCFYRSAACLPHAECWSIENTKTARQVSKNSHTKYSYDCSECKHKFMISPLHVAYNQWCGYCNGHALCDDQKCEFCYEASLASHPYAKYWSKRNKLTPRQVRKNSNEKFWFECPTCSHEFEAILCNVVINGSRCPYCCFPTRALCKDEKCKHCDNNSMASSHRAEQWSSSNKLRPRDVFKNSHAKQAFDCEVCKHRFVASPNAITTGGTWCPLCKKKTEKKMYEWLIAKLPNFTIEREKKFDWCKNEETNRHLPFDFYIKELNLIIEVDGPQHFRQVLNWESPEEIQKRDRYKKQCLVCNGVSIIRVLQEDVFNDVNQWEEHLSSTLDPPYPYENSHIYSIYNNIVEMAVYQ